MKRLLLFFAFAFLLISCKDEHSDLPDGLYADIETVKGPIIVKLEYEKVPVTVANFVSLAEGKNPFVDAKFRGKPFYDGLKFHRVVSNFMIQGGDPLGTGSGDAGYKFKDEITDLTHDKPGTLSMANSGPDTNSSQFFITHVETPWLDGRHTVFGHVVGKGMESVNKIVQDDGIISVTIIRRGEKAKKFDAVKVFSNYFTTESENQKKKTAIESEANAAAKKAYLEKFGKEVEAEKTKLESVKTDGSETRTGLVYKVLKAGSGKKPEPGSTVYVRYAGFFEDGTLFDSNMPEVAKKFGKFDLQRDSQKGYQSMPFQYGRKEGLIPGFIEAIEKMSFGDKIIVFIPSEMAYGQAGSQNGFIPPNSNLYFELELSQNK